MESTSYSEGHVINPGPEDPSLLHCQHKHISQLVWNGAPDRVLRIKRAVGAHRHGPNEIPEPIIPLLEEAGFLGVAKLAFFSSNHNLISALVERWRPETHTFHMPPGECTITLQDIAIQAGLRIDGRPVIGPTSVDVHDVCERYLGVVPPDTACHGSRIRMRWLEEQFGDLANHIENPIQFHRYVRAYILRLIGGVLFPDKSSTLVPLRYLPLLDNFTEAGQYSWGSAALAYLYRELCNATAPDAKDMSGFTALLQLWAWERFPSIAPDAPAPRDPTAPLGARYVKKFYLHDFVLLDIIIVSYKFINV